MKPFVYVVIREFEYSTSYEYSEEGDLYQIEGIFETEEKAQAYAKEHNKRKYNKKHKITYSVDYWAVS